MATVTVALSALWVLSAACLPAVPLSGGLLTLVGDVGAVSTTVGLTVSTSTMPLLLALVLVQAL